MKRNKLSTTALSILAFLTILLINFPINLYAQTEDTTPPQLVEFDFAPKAIDISSGPQDVTLTMRITDDLLGVSSGTIFFQSPSGQHNVTAGIGNRISGDALDGTYQSVMIVPQFVENGVYHLIKIELYDPLNGGQLSEQDLIALGFPTELEVLVEPTIEGILIFFDEAVAAGTLEGSGPGNSADGRRNALRNMLEMAGDLINIKDMEGACGQLNACLKKCDGEPKPPEFVVGPSASDLMMMIEELMSHFVCE